MTIENDKRIVKNHKILIITALVTAALALFLGINEGEIIKGKIFGFTPGTWAIFLIILYLCYLIIFIYLEPHYIFYSDDNEVIIFRYYSTFKFSPIKHSIEIPKSDFLFYKIKSDFTGLKKKLTLYRQTIHGRAKYPEICLSFLSTSEVKLLIESLNKYQKIN